MARFAPCESVALYAMRYCGLVNNEQPVEKVFFLSLRAKRGNLAFNKINGLEIASSQKLLLAMTCDGFFNRL
jgi:hypothetical protein